MVRQLPAPSPALEWFVLAGSSSPSKQEEEKGAVVASCWDQLEKQLSTQDN